MVSTPGVRKPNYVTTPEDEAKAVAGLERVMAAFLDDLTPAWQGLMRRFCGLHRRADGAVLLVDSDGAMEWTGVLDSGARFTMVGMELSLSWPSGREIGPFDDALRGWQGLVWTPAGELGFDPGIVFDYELGCPWEPVDQRHLPFGGFDEVLQRDGRTHPVSEKFANLVCLAEGPDVFALSGDVLLPGEWPVLESWEGGCVPQ